MLPEAVIGRVTIRASARGDPDALRRAVARQLAAAELAPAAGGPSAVLVVRCLADPHPRGLSASPAALHPDPRWEAAVREALDRHRRSAARPDRGRVDPSAGAVLFEDEAELLACVARSLALDSGAAPWWRAAVARHLPARALPALLASEVGFLPAVLARLDVWGAAEPVARAVPGTDALRLVAAMASALELPAALASLSAPPPAAGGKGTSPVRQAFTGSGSGPRRPRGGHAGPQPVPRPSPPPWRAFYAPPSDARLEPAQEALLGIGLAVHRVSRAVRTRPFAEAAAAWVRRAPDHQVAEEPAATRRPLALRFGAPADEATRAAAMEEPGELRASAATTARGAVAKAQGRAGSRAKSPPGAPERGPPSAPHALSPRVAGAATPSVAPQDAAPARLDRPPAPESSVSTSRADADLLAAFGEGPETGLGGILFLLNAMEALELPACFEPDCGLATEVGVAGTLEALARALLAGSDARPGDPIWALLAALDGRPKGAPPRGEGLRADALRLPAAWLAPVAAEVEPLRSAMAGDRLLLLAAAGFPVADVPLEGEDPLAQAAAEAARAGRAPPVGAVTAVREAPALDLLGWPAPLARWTAFVAPFLRHRLARALGHPRADGVALTEALLAMPARLHATETHVDLVATLDAVRLPVRLAGLDRSPGWVPRLGRVVLFHFR